MQTVSYSRFNDIHTTIYALCFVHNVRRISCNSAFVYEKKLSNCTEVHANLTPYFIPKDGNKVLFIERSYGSQIGVLEGRS